MGLTNFPNGISSMGMPVFPGLDILSPFGTTYFVDNANGKDGNSGKQTTKAYATITKAAAVVVDGDNIVVRGTASNYDESVTITVPRITMLGVNFGENSGAWNADADATCLTFSDATNSRVSGFLFRPDGATTGCAINVSEVTAELNDSIIIDNNVFKSTGTTAAYGILANGCPAYLKVYNNHFTWLTTAMTNTTCTTTSATGWEVMGNYFSDKCTNGIYMTMRRCRIEHNTFSAMTVALDTYGYAATNADYNSVHYNALGGAFNTAVYQGCTNDDWYGNATEDGFNTADPTA